MKPTPVTQDEMLQLQYGQHYVYLKNRVAELEEYAREHLPQNRSRESLLYHLNEADDEALNCVTEL